MRQVAPIPALTLPLSGCGWLSNSFAGVSVAKGFGPGDTGLPGRATVPRADDRRDLFGVTGAGPWA